MGAPCPADVLSHRLDDIGQYRGHDEGGAAQFDDSVKGAEHDGDVTAGERGDDRV